MASTRNPVRPHAWPEWAGYAQLRDVLATIVEGSDDAVIVKDLTGRYVLVNGAATRFLGRAPSDILGRVDADVSTPERARVDVDNDRRVLASEQTATFESKVMIAGAPRVFLSTKFVYQDDRGEVAGVVCIARDITERKQAELDVRAEMSRYEALARAQSELGDGMLLIDRRGERVVHTNECFAALSGYTLVELRSLDSVARVLPDLRMLLEPRDTARGSDPVRTESRILTKSGGVVQIEAAAKRLGPAQDWLVLVRDITEHRRTQASLIYAGRLNAVGRLAAGIAHELNNPLAYVSANLEYVSDAVREITSQLPPSVESSALVEEFETAMQDAREGAERMRIIVRDVGSFAGASEDTVALLDVNDIVLACARMTANEIRHRARLVKSLRTAPQVLGNEARLKQVFLNLLVNASEAVAEGGVGRNEVTITTGTDASGRVIVEIKDTGCGISEEHLSHVFDPFFTTKPVGRGTGLGLSVCHGIVSSMGGEITVESVLGKGTTFRVSLLSVSSNAPSEKPPSSSSIPPRRARILVVDDESSLLSSLHRRMSAEYDLVLSSSASSALGEIEKGARFDAILCDVMMPDLSAEQLYARLREVAPDQLDAIIFVTGGAFTPRARAFLESVPNVCIDKPIDATKLRLVLRRILKRRANPARPPR